LGSSHLRHHRGSAAPQERVTYDLLFVIDLASRGVHLAGGATNPTADGIKQIARNLTDPLDGFPRDKRYLLMHRDSKCGEAFRHLLEQAGVHCVRLPARSPNRTPHIERCMRTLKEECLDRMILFVENFLQKATHQFLAHDHRERNHQGMDNRILDAGEEVGQLQGEIRCRQRLGGMLRSYDREAA